MFFQGVISKGEDYFTFLYKKNTELGGKINKINNKFITADIFHAGYDAYVITKGE